MRRSLVLLVVVLCFTSCGTTSLYYWGDSMQGTSAYEALSYKRTHKESPKAICRVIEMYEHLLAYPGGSRQVPPPGICAEYAYMLLQPEIMNTFNSSATSYQKRAFNESSYGNNPTNKAIKLFEQEITLYPESAQFILPLLNRLKK